MLRHAIFTTVLAFLGAAPGSLWALDSRDYIDRSVELIEGSKYSLARTYLNPAVLDFRLSAGERSRAYYLRGYSYYAQGLFVSASKDYHRALEFNPGNPGALVALGDLYLRGRGVTRDEKLAFHLFERAAELGHDEAAIQIGYAYLEGAGTERNVPLGRKWLESKAEDGNALAMAYLARSYRVGYADPPEPKTAAEWYEKSAAAGNRDALVALAYMYQKGELGEPDLTRAAELFRQAADLGSSAAQVSLGHIYLTGTGVPEDLAAARNYFELAAGQNNPAGHLGLGHIFEAGAGVAPDPAAAREHYEQAAKADLGPAQMRLVYLLLAEGDTVQAMSWLSRAADQDMPEAHNDYAWMLATLPDAHLRNGQLALEHAKLAVARVESPAYLDTLAAAYAELGRFTEAITTQEQAISMVDASDTALLEELNEHLKAYQAGEPWRG